MNFSKKSIHYFIVTIILSFTLLNSSANAFTPTSSSTTTITNLRSSTATIPGLYTLKIENHNSLQRNYYYRKNNRDIDDKCKTKMNMVASGAASVMGVVSGGILGGALHAIAGEYKGTVYIRRQPLLHAIMVNKNKFFFFIIVEVEVFFSTYVSTRALHTTKRLLITFSNIFFLLFNSFS